MRGLTDESGSLTGSANYDAFGSVTSQSGTTSIFGYTGEQTDPTGNVHLRARAYDPETGRFLSTDTVQPNAPGTQGYNRYAYVANNPTTWTDPTGHEAAALPAAGAGALPRLIPFLLANWLPIGIGLAALFLLDCALQSPTGICNALAAFVITVFIVVACVLEVGGPCWGWVQQSSSRPRTETRDQARDKPVDVAPSNPTPPGSERKPFRHPDWDTIRRIGTKYGKRCWQVGDFIYFLDTSLQHFQPHIEVWSNKGQKRWLGQVPKDGGELSPDPKRDKQNRNVNASCGK